MKTDTFKAAKPYHDKEKDNFSWWQTVLLAFASHASLQSKPGMIILTPISKFGRDGNYAMGV